MNELIIYCTVYLLARRFRPSLISFVVGIPPFHEPLFDCHSIAIIFQIVSLWFLKLLFGCGVVSQSVVEKT
jgi:hypothetical protein